MNHSKRARRVALIGSGANGTGIAVDLAQAGCDLTVIEQWPAHVEAIRAEGARVELPTETLRQQLAVQHVCQVAELRGKFDVILLLVKAYDTRWTAELMRPRLADDGLMVGVQNGMTAEAIADIVGPERTLGCVIECSAAMWEPGLVRRYTPPANSWFAVGALNEAATDREAELVELLAHSGTVEVFADISSAKWMKLVSNCSVLVTTAALGLPMLDAIAVPGFRELMVAAGEEALTVGQARGFQTLPIFGLTEADLQAAESVVVTMLDRLYAGFVRPGAVTTVLQDWQKGRRSEAHDLNGEVCRWGRALGIATPANDAIIAVADEIEDGRTTPSLDLAQRLSNF